MSSYSRVHYEDRLKIEVLLKAGHGVCAIARLIGKHHSTISREIKRGQYVHRNSDWTEEVRYSPELAEERYQNQLKEKGPEKILNLQNIWRRPFEIKSIPPMRRYRK